MTRFYKMSQDKKKEERMNSLIKYGMDDILLIHIFNQSDLLLKRKND